MNEEMLQEKRKGKKGGADQDLSPMLPGRASKRRVGFPTQKTTDKKVRQGGETVLIPLDWSRKGGRESFSTTSLRNLILCECGPSAHKGDQG